MKTVRAIVHFTTHPCDGKPELKSGSISVRHEIDYPSDWPRIKEEIAAHVRKMLPVVAKINVGMILPDEEVTA